ncbi:hypothetical protein FKM82_028104 [Ascaphus truei]
MDWDGHHDFGVPGGLPGFGVCIPSLDSLPLGSAVLEPDFDLDLAELQGVGYLGPLGEGQVLLAVELLLQLQELLAGERRPPPPVLPRGCGVVGTIRVLGALLQGTRGVLLLVGSLAGDVIIRAVI